MAEKNIDDVSGVETTGHEWDGIRELNNPLPRWWLWTFYATIVWAIGYMVLYPAIPLATEATKGIWNYSSREAVSQELARANAERADVLDKIVTASLDEIRTDQNLFQFATAGGESAFKVYCSQCHGSGAAGSPGFPNLNDDDWIWGGTLEAIETTLQHGVRYAADDDTRISDMPAFGADGILSRAEIADTAEHVLKLAGQDHDAEAAERGAVIYADNCAACHGDNGEGIHEVGAPRLSDPIWLYGGERADIIAQLNQPKQGVMPAWGQRLDPATVKQLAVYVHSLGGGQ
jgi:cytochrome c oxidase cbb3-type subunit 3